MMHTADPLSPAAFDKSVGLRRGLESTASIEGPSSDAVALLFGSDLASVADFVCTHRRIRGRLYATPEMILFYSNLLGFETRIAVLFADVLSMTLCRTTSIEIFLQDGEIYTFRSFQDREQVLQVLRQLKASDDRKRSIAEDGSLLQTFSTDSSLQTPQQRRRHLRGQTSDPTALASMRLMASNPSAVPVLTDDGENSLASSVATLRHSNRQRAASESNLFHVSTTPEESGNLNESQSDHDETLTSVLKTSNDEEFDSAQLERQWERALEMKHMVGTDHVGIDQLILACGLPEFFDKFLADGAHFSMDRYQSNEIGDTDLHITPWTQAETSSSMPTTSTRTMTFVHPILNSMGVGPTEARTSRVQRLCRYSDFGLTLENTTQVVGIPAADCFYVRDHWLVEALQGGDQVRLTARFGTHFHKRTLLKSFIEKSVVQQSKDWFAGYSQMLTKALFVAGPAKDATETPQALTHALPDMRDERLDALERTLRRLVGWVAFLAVAVVMMTGQLFALSLAVDRLRADIVSIKDEIQAEIRRQEAHGMSADPVYLQ